jgi:hypothetical protein
MKNNNKQRSTLLIMLIVTIAIHHAYANSTAEHPVFIMHSNQQLNSPTSTWLTHTYTELFNRIGVQLRIVHFPGERANIAAQSGDIDGQFTRIYEYQDLYSNQIRIDVPIIKLSTIAYVRVTDQISLPTSWNSLKDLKLRIDYVRGIINSQQNLEKQVKAPYLTTSTDLREGLLKLKYNRTDIFIHGNIAVYPALQTDDYKHHLTEAGVLNVTLLYPYIHHNHFRLAPQIETTLKALHEEGLVLQYCIDAYGEGYEEFCRSIQP